MGDGDNVLSLGVIGGKTAEYFNRPEEKKHHGRLEQLFLLLSPDGSNNDLTKDELQALKRRNRDGTFKSVAKWQDVKVKFNEVIQAAKENKLTPKIMENFYRGLFPNAESDFPHQLANIEQKPLRPLPVRDGRFYDHIDPPKSPPRGVEMSAIAVISFGMARVNCDTIKVKDKKEKVEICTVLAREAAQDDLAARNSTPDIFCWSFRVSIDDYFLVQDGVPKYSIGFVKPEEQLNCKERTTSSD